MKNKNEILRSLRNHKNQFEKFGVKDIGLFGSCSKEKQNIHSDIDILISFKPGEENFDNLMNIYDYLEKLFKDEKIEVVTKNGLSPYIGKKILKETIYV